MTWIRGSTTIRRSTRDYHTCSIGRLGFTQRIVQHRITISVRFAKSSEIAKAMTLDPQISLHHTTLPSSLPGSPSFVFHLTRLTDTLLVWIATGQPTESPSSDEMILPTEKRLAQDWAVAMPPRGVSNGLPRCTGPEVTEYSLRV